MTPFTASSTFITFAVFLNVFTYTRGQFGGGFNPFLFGEAGEELLEGIGFGGEDGGASFLFLQNLRRQIQTLELNVRTGAIGGCESGTVGPLSPLQPTGFIQFNRPFLTPPTITLGLTSLAQANPVLPVNFAVNPTSVTTAGATVTLTDLTNNIAGAVFNYMACPNNASPVINSNSGTNNFNTGVTG